MQPRWMIAAIAVAVMAVPGTADEASEKAERDARKAIAAAEQALEEVQASLVRAAKALDAGEPIDWGAVSQATERARGEAATLAAVATSQVGVPRISVSPGKVGFRPEKSAQRQRDGSWKWVSDGGVFAIPVRLTIENAAKPIHSIDLRLVMRDFEGKPRKFHWTKRGAPLVAGESVEAVAAADVPEGGVTSCWLWPQRGTVQPHAVTVQVVRVHYADGTEAGYGRR